MSKLNFMKETAFNLHWPMFNLYATGFKLATVNLRVRHYFRLAFKFLYMVYKKLYYFRNQKSFNNG